MAPGFSVSPGRAVVVLGEGLPDTGGSGANQANLSLGLAARGYAVAFASRWPVPAGGARVTALRAAGVSVLAMPDNVSNAVRYATRAMAPMDRAKYHHRRAQVLDALLTRSVRRWARGHGPIVVHIFGRETTQSLAAVKALGFPIVFSELGQLMNLGMNEVDVRAQPLGVDRYTADSTKAAALLGEVEGVAVPFVPSVGGFSWKPTPAREVAEEFGMLSRLDEVKRVHIAVAAFGAFDRGRLTIYGEGPEVGRVRAAIADGQLGGRVRLGGVVGPADVACVLDGLDVLVLTSDDSEGTPVAALEAMSRARPVIATRAGGLPDLIEDGVTGLFFDGSPSDLSAKMEEITRPGVARQMGEAARAAWADRYSADIAINAFEAIYDSLA